MCISRTTTSKTAATFKPSAHLWRLELRVSPIIRIKPAESLYGGHAMAKVFLEMLAEVPQIKKRTFWRLRDSRKSKRERFGVCGTPANQKKNVLALAEVPQAFPKALWPLQRSIQAILQGLGASFFRSSSRCKDFWKGRSAVEGIRFAPIDRLEAIRSCDLYPKCQSDPATHFRPRWTGHRIANGFPPFQTAPTFAALKT